MEAAITIRDAVAQVGALRAARGRDRSLGDAVRSVKALQSRRFAGTYADLLAGGEHAAAARFFLDELYSDQDYAERDAQFSRIAGAVQSFFPAQVAATAASLARLHLVTEQLDHAMGQAWLDHSGTPAKAARYVAAWRQVSQRPAREAQLAAVMEIGREMTQLTRTPGLRLMLRMMRGPAGAAGLQALQRFLEAGFDTFGAMARRGRGAEAFLSTVRSREQTFIVLLFDAPAVACETELSQTLGLAR